MATIQRLMTYFALGLLWPQYWICNLLGKVLCTTAPRLANACFKATSNCLNRIVAQEERLLDRSKFKYTCHRCGRPTSHGDAYMDKGQITREDPTCLPCMFIIADERKE